MTQAISPLKRLLKTRSSPPHNFNRFTRSLFCHARERVRGNYFCCRRFRKKRFSTPFLIPLLISKLFSMYHFAVLMIEVVSTWARVPKFTDLACLRVLIHPVVTSTTISAWSPMEIA